MKVLPVLMLLLTGCEQAEPERTSQAPTIVSLNPCSDAILADVAAPGQLLAISHYSHDPAATSMPIAQARAFASTGGTVEEVLVLAPDVVVADIFLPPASRAAFDRLGVQVESVGIAGTVADSEAQIRALAALAGQIQAGEEMTARIESAWQRTAYNGSKISTLLWQQGGLVPGPDSLIAQLLEHTGFALHSAARGLGQGAYVPLEALLADPPELILAASDDRMLTHPVLAQLDGMTYRRFDPALLFCGGPSIIAALDRLAAIRAELP